MVTTDDADAGPRPVHARLRELPGIDRLLAQASDLVDAHGLAAATDALRDAVAAARMAIRDGAPPPDDAALVAAAGAALLQRQPAPLQPVLNATGVIVHTNLGRAPLAATARDAMAAAAGYCDLEYDLATGRRGSRGARVEPLLREATGAEAALVVNNAAAALVLALAALAGGREVVVSRGELIEIGGSFRLPDIMAASGARLVEVGTTNRTRADDYLAGDDAAAILTLHPSNYRIVGFVAQPTLADLAAVGAGRGIPVIYDVGSGLLTRADGVLADEPAVDDAVRGGADVVLCSGDKLLGGPQAGLLVGRRDLIDRCRRHPLARALRLDKLRIAALQATLELHVRDRQDQIPVWRMLGMDTDTAERRCRRLADAVTERGLDATVGWAAGVPGGGSGPDTTLPGPVVHLTVSGPTALAERLRAQRPPLIVRIVDETVVIDLRTVDEADDDLVADLLVRAGRSAS
jgi:L-seryl-tRNA(Ser) seleniumtransferase